MGDNGINRQIQIHSPIHHYRKSIGRKLNLLQLRQ